MNHEKIQYIEFPAKDLDASKAFFSSVFGWTFQDFSKDYTAFSDAGLEGGFFESDQAAQTKNGSALLVFYSNDLEATLQKILDAGGKLAKPIFSFPGGRRFHFFEPSENEMAVWSDK